MSPIESDDYLTTEQLAELMHISGAAVRRLVGEPGCPALRLGRAYRWPRLATLRWLTERARVATPASA